MGAIKATRNEDRQLADVIGHIPSVFLSRREKGGTEELHSRTGNGAPGRPCQLAALSGRRAAQDGQGRVLGGPARAGVGRSGEALSAGRAAAPDQFPRELLGRGRSADRVAHALAERAKPGGECGHGEAARASARARPFQAMARAVFSVVAAVGLLIGPARAADIVVGPGAQGTIEIPIENNDGSILPLTNVRVQITAPSAFVVSSSSTLSSVLPGETQNIIVSYQIAGTATEADNPITVGLAVRMDGDDIEPAPTTYDTSVLGRLGFARACIIGVVDAR